MEVVKCLWVMGVQVNIFLFKQKTAYEMRISDWSSDVCSSDLPGCPLLLPGGRRHRAVRALGRRQDHAGEYAGRPAAPDARPHRAARTDAVRFAAWHRPAAGASAPWLRVPGKIGRA